MIMNLLLNDSQRNIKNIFPRGTITPTVFTLKPNQSLLLGSLIQIDYLNDSLVWSSLDGCILIPQKDNLVGYIYSTLQPHIHNKDKVETILTNHAGKDYVPFYSKEQYDLTGGIVEQQRYPLNTLLSTFSTVCFTSSLHPAVSMNRWRMSSMDITPSVRFHQDSLVGSLSSRKVWLVLCLLIGALQRRMEQQGNYNK